MATPTEVEIAEQNQVAIHHETNEIAWFEFAQRFAAAAAQSNYFGDATSMPQALMKIAAGRELGIAPFVALSGINIIKGRPVLTGELIGAMLQNQGLSWKFGQHDQNGCVLYLYRDGRMIENQDGSHATVSFTREDAERAGLTAARGSNKETSTYDKYGMDMFFNRCIVRFQRRFAPGATKGIPILTPDEAAEIYTPAPSIPQRKEVTTDAAV